MRHQFTYSPPSRKLNYKRVNKMSMGLFSYDEPPRRRHYCQLANGRASNGPNYWFAVARTKITSYDSRFNGDFRIIIYRNQSPRNYYAIPYRVFRQLLTPSHFDSSVGNGRWIGTIVNDILSISKSPHEPNCLNVSRYKNIPLD